MKGVCDELNEELERDGVINGTYIDCKSPFTNYQNTFILKLYLAMFQNELC